MPPDPKSTHGQILKSSALIGGSSVVNVLVGMIRVKFTAVYLGPLGVGLFGAYTTILNPIATLANMGISASGVRDIAEAAGAGDQQRIARSLLTVRRATCITGLLGVLVTLALAYPLSLSTFGNTDHVLALCVLSLTILLGSVASGLGAILQGLRRIRDMAAQGVLGAVLSLPVCIPMMMLWGVDSIVPMMLAGSAVSLLITWWFARRVRVEPVQMTWRESWVTAKPMLKLGLVFVSSGLMGTAVAYLTRVIIIRELGLEANGLYSAAWTLSSYYVGFILSAMGADFYPRLTEVNQNPAEMNRLVNEQIEVGLLMALPGLLATLTLAPLVIMLFYTPKFNAAVELLQWQVFGVALRLVCWPLGYIMIAKGAKRWFFWTELFSHTASLGLIWLGIELFGLVGAGIAFSGFYALYLLLVIYVAHRMTRFSWATGCIQLMALTACLCALAFLAARLLPLPWSAGLGVALASGTAWYSMRTLTRLVGRNPLTAAWEKLKQVLPFPNKILES